jgi:hypothetical protein
MIVQYLTPYTCHYNQRLIPLEAATVDGFTSKAQEPPGLIGVILNIEAGSHN